MVITATIYIAVSLSGNETGRYKHCMDWATGIEYTGLD